MDSFIFEHIASDEILRHNEKQNNSSLPSSASTRQNASSADKNCQSLASTDCYLLDECAFSTNPSDYDVGKVIGFGSSAVVSYAVYKPSGKEIAIKMIDLDRFERNQIDELRKEIQVMSLCRHPNLLPIYASFVVLNKLWIVTPFLKGGSCLDILKNHAQDGLEESIIASILLQTAQGIDYLHRNNLIHRDIKAGNLILDADGQVYLSDFGVSASLMDDGERKGIRKTFVGTPCWMAPEVMEMNKGYDFKADIWSLGITALELANGSAPFAKFPPMKVIYLTLSSNPPTLDRSKTKHKYSKNFKELIDLCLQREPSKRPTADMLMKHPFFKQAKKKGFLAEFVGRYSVFDKYSNHETVDQSASRRNTENELTNSSWNFSDKECNSTYEDTNSDVIDEVPDAKCDVSPRVKQYSQNVPSTNSASGAKEKISGNSLKDLDAFLSISNISLLSSSHTNNSVPNSAVSISDSNIKTNSSLDTIPKKSRFIVEGQNDANSLTSDANELSNVRLSKSSSSSSSSSTDSESGSGGGSSEIRKGRFSVSESGPSVKEAQLINFVSQIDTVIEKQTPKVGRFILNSSQENVGICSVGSRFNLKYLDLNERDCAVVSKQELEALVDSNNQLKSQLDDLIKEEAKRRENPLFILKELENSIKTRLNIEQNNSS